MNATRSELAPSTKSPVVLVTGLPRTGVSLMVSMLKAGGSDVQHVDPDGLIGVGALRGHHLGDEHRPDQVLEVPHGLLHWMGRQRSYRVILMQRSIEDVVATQHAIIGIRVSHAKIRARYRTQRDEMENTLRNPRISVDVLRVPFDQLLYDPHGCALEICQFAAVVAGVLDPIRMAGVVTRNPSYKTPATSTADA